MATQDTHSIRFTHTSPQNNFRLLELPPDLLEELSSDKAQTLYLKSPPPAAPSQHVSMPGSHSSVEADYVNLCTSTKTYQIRQVQSSNSIILARPSLGDINPGTLEQGDGDGDAMEQDDTAFGSLDTVTAIAQCKATLEVYKSEDGLPSAIAFLERTLPVYDHLVVEDDDVNMAMNTTSATMTDIEKMKLAKEAVLNDVPLSQAECESGWIEICAFVHAGGKVGKQASSWRPSAKTKLEVWKKTLEASVLQGIELDKQFLVKDLWKAVTDEDEEEPPFQKSLLEAVIRRLMDEQSLEASKGSDSALKWANLDKDISVRWAAETYLDAAAPTSATAIPRKEFLTAWGDHLPEVWRSEASWANLKDGTFEYPDATSICFLKKKIGKKDAVSSTDTGSQPSAKGARKWHEKFKNLKR